MTDMLSRRTRKHFAWLTDYPTTNAIKVHGLVLMWIVTIAVGVASVAGYDVKEYVLMIVYGAILSMMGVAQWAHKVKRENPLPFPHTGGVDVEDARATVGSAAMIESEAASESHGGTRPEGMPRIGGEGA